jgi:DNA-binding NtrC family response regulator
MARVLLIEDDPDSSRQLYERMRRAGLDVVGARDMEAIDRLLERRRVDLVITDLFMPQKEGLEAVPIVRSHAPGVPIIGLCGGPSPNGPAQHEASEGPLASDVTALALELGVYRVLPTPFEWEAFDRAVRDALQGSLAGTR